MKGKYKMQKLENQNKQELNFSNFMKADKVVPLYLASNKYNYSPYDILLVPKSNQATWDLLHNAQFINQLMFCQRYDEFHKIADDFNVELLYNRIDCRNIIKLYLDCRNYHFKDKSYTADFVKFDVTITDTEQINHVSDNNVNVVDTIEYPLGKKVNHLNNNQVMLLNKDDTPCYLTINGNAVVLKPLDVMGNGCYYILTINENTPIEVHNDDSDGRSYVLWLTKQNVGTIDCKPSQCESFYFENQNLRPMFLNSDDSASSFEKLTNIEYVNVYENDGGRSLYNNPFQYQTNITKCLHSLNQRASEINGKIAKLNSTIQFKVTNYQAKDYWLIKPTIKQSVRLNEIDCFDKNYLIDSTKVEYILMQRFNQELMEQVSNIFDVCMEENDYQMRYHINLAPIKIMHPQQYIFNEDGKWNDDVSDYDKVLNVVALTNDNQDVRHLIVSLQKYLSVLDSANKGFNYDKQQIQEIANMLTKVDRLFVATLLVHDYQDVISFNYQALQIALQQLSSLLTTFDANYASYVDRFYHELWQACLDKQLDQSSFKKIVDDLDLIAFRTNNRVK